MNLSLCYVKSGDSAGAEYFAAKGLEIEPRSAKAWYRRAMAAVATGDHEKAEECLAKSASIEPANADVRRELAKVRDVIAQTRKAQSKVFASMLTAVTTPEDEERERKEREKREAAAKRSAEMAAAIKPLPPKKEEEEEKRDPDKPRMPLMDEIEAVIRTIDETENELRQLLMGRVREEKLVDVESVDEDIAAWSEALKRMSFNERIKLAKEMFETRKGLLRAANLADSVKIPETVARLESENMDTLRELKERAEEAGDEQAVAKLSVAKDKLLRLVRRFDFAGSLQRVVDMGYSCAVGRDITKGEGNIKEVLEEFGSEPQNGGF